MTDMPQDVAANVAPVPQQGTGEYKSKRGRRLMIIIIILLLLGLAAITALLLSLVAPRAGVATGDEAGGLTWVKSIYGWGSTPETQLMSPQELSIDNGGLIWVTDARYPDRAIAFTPEGKLAKTVGENSKEKIVTVGPVLQALDQRLFVAEPAMDRIRVFDRSAQDMGYITFPNPIDLAAHEDRMVVGSTAGFAIINANDGKPVKVVGARGKKDNEFDTVNGVAIGEDGRIYVVDAYNNRLSAYDTEGERLWIVETGAPGNKVDLSGGGAMAASSQTDAPAKLQLPADITIDGRGRLVVVDSMDFSISVFDPKDGKFIAKYGEYGPQDGNFIYPSSISYDPQRDWFAIADAGNSRVQIIRIPDSGPFDAAAAARRALSGPLRACLIPLLLLLLLLLFLAWRRRNEKKRQKEAAAAAAAAAATAVPVTEETSIS
ncbi:MAG: hypothetical protein HY876_09890 [Coriobacteriales bacterium]|nr:hypothetical protein [Coriobacteriales bacterium]